MNGTLILHPETGNEIKRYLDGSHGPLILLGEKAMGKMTTALELAKALLCQGKNSGKPCMRCESCRQEFPSHPDLFLISGDGAWKMDQVRELFDQDRYQPVLAEKKVVILDNADGMSVNAQNAMLKLLEDSSYDHTIILVAHNRMLATIHSRCTSIRFYPVEDIPESEFKELLALIGGGRYGQMELFRGKADFLKDLGLYLEVMAGMREKREILSACHALREKDKDNIFEKYGKEEMLAFLKVNAAIFQSCLGNGTPELRQEVTDHVKTLYDREQLIEILNRIARLEHKVRYQNYNKNDFFSLLQELAS